jgi:hypothetical protein
MHFVQLKKLALALSMMMPAALAVMMLPHSANAQTNTTGAIDGVISDPSGAIIPNAAVAITNSATGAIFKVTSSATGEYRVSQLPPGPYNVVVTATGF